MIFVCCCFPFSSTPSTLSLSSLTLRVPFAFVFKDNVFFVFFSTIAVSFLFHFADHASFSSSLILLSSPLFLIFASMKLYHHLSQSKFLFALTLLFSLACLAWFVYSLWLRSDEVLALLPSFFSDRLLIFSEVFLLLANVSLEALRWRVVYSGHVRCSFLHSLKTVLLASALGNASPANLGEHLARSLDASDKKTAASLSVLASALTSLSIFLVGSVASALLFSLGSSLSNAYSSLSTLYPLLTFSAAFVLLVALAAFLAVRFSSRLSSLLSSTLALVGVRRALLALALGCLRVLVFSLQLFLLLSVGSLSPALPLFLLVLVYYLFLTFLPRLNFVDVGVKGALAAAVFAPSLVEPSAVYSATVLLWLLNIVLPSLLGFSLFFFSLRRSAHSRA